MDVIGADVIGSFSTFGMAHLPAGSVSHGIRFHPGGFPALFRVPASDLIDMRVPMCDVARGVRSLEDLSRWTRTHRTRSCRPCWVGSDIRAVSRDCGYSQRQLRRRVFAATGHGPKRLMRIARMQRLLLDGRGESWARSAVEHGYYDEAHMANDVRELVGATPHALLQRPFLPSPVRRAAVPSG